MTNAPLRLDEGFYLESSKVLLPWGAPWNELKRIGRPGVYDRPKARGYSEIVWWNRTCLGGLKCTVEAEIFYVGAGWPNGDKKLGSLDILLPGPGSARAKFRAAEKHLRRVLGRPTSRRKRSDGHSTFPLAAWSFPNATITLSVGERYVEYFSFVIEWVRKTTKPCGAPRPARSRGRKGRTHRKRAE